jgi:hydroxymethylpyrimidine pyrophosphatase-like HAD family hydrolase
MKYALVVSDYDGTLTDDQAGICPDANYEAVQRYHEAGGVFAINSGRDLFSLMERLEGTPFGEMDLPLISSHGAMISFSLSKKIIYQKGLEREFLQQLTEFLGSKFPYTIFCEKGIVLVPGMVLFEKFLLDSLPRIRLESSKEYLTFPSLVYKARISYTKKNKEDLMAFLEKQPNLQIIHPSHSFIEVVHRSVSKGNALHILRNYYHLLPEQTVGVGDSRIDVSLLTASGLAVAVANAHVELQEVADLILEQAGGQAISWLLDQIIRNLI